MAAKNNSHHGSASEEKAKHFCILYFSFVLCIHRCLRITHPLQPECFYVGLRCFFLFFFFLSLLIVERASSRCSGTRDDGDGVISGRMKVVKITNIINSENLLLLSPV